jgi:hypothetical protein
MEASTLWPDPERRPDPLNGSVIPLADDDGADDSDETQQTRDAEISGPQQPIDPTKDNFDSLPLPYDITATKTPTPNNSAISTSGDPSTGTLNGEKATSHEGTEGEDENPGLRFIAWLKENIASSRVEINTARARIHVLREGLALVSPGIFRDFDAAGWNKAQKRFQKLKLHLKRPDGTNIWTCRVAKDRKQSLIKVILIPEPEKALGVKLPPPNPAVTLLNEDSSKPKEAPDGEAV